MKVNAIKDGKGNIVISEESFGVLLNFLDNQKFMHEQGSEIRDYNQKVIDDFNQSCRKILNQKYVFSLSEEGYFLSKRYDNQTEDTEWTGEDVGLVRELFKDTRIVYKKREDLLPLDGSEEIMQGDKPLGKTLDGWIAVEPEPRPWLIERPMRYDGQYLTISEDGKKNRPWKQEELEKIREIFNSK